MTRNRRALVLGDESARHPFRQTLPHHVRASAIAATPDSIWHRIAQGDWRTILTAYSACFVSVLTFIA